jgi:MFS family permease
VNEARDASPGPDWGRRALLAVVGLVVVLAGYLLLAAYLPRWWAQRMGDLINGRFAVGVWWGLFFGFVFTVVPLVVARQALRKRWRWQTRVVIVAVALLLAAPNLITLGIVLGDGNAAHAGERILDVDGPAFRGASLFGALGGAIAAGALQFLVSSRRRRGRMVKDLRSDIRSRDDEARRRAEQEPLDH